MIFDTHAHLNFSAFKNDADEVIKRSLEAGVFMINAGSQYSTSVRAVEYAEKYEGVFAAVGLHPIHVEKTQIAKRKAQNKEDEDYCEKLDYKKYLELARNPKVVAIGEMGLDYYHIEGGVDIEEVKNRQKEVFLEGIRLANEVGKPLIIHCREAYDDLLEILKNNPIDKKGVVHCFVGSLKTAENFIELGYRIGLNGIITYSTSYDKLIRNISLDDIVLETDCPYLAPAPLSRDARNEPANVKYVAEKIAQIKDISAEKVAETTNKNALAVFLTN